MAKINSILAVSENLQEEQYTLCHGRVGRFGATQWMSSKRTRGIFALMSVLRPSRERWKRLDAHVGWAQADAAPAQGGWGKTRWGKTIFGEAPWLTYGVRD